MTGHRLLASVLRLCLCALGVRRGQPRSTCSTCAALPPSISSACRCREIPVAEGRTVANGRDEPTTTTRCVEIAAPTSFHLAHRPPLRVPGGMRAGRWFKLLFCAGQSGAKNNVSRHRAIAHIAGGWYGVVRCDRPPPVDHLHLCRAARTRRTTALPIASSGGVMEPVSCRLACPGRCGGRWAPPPVLPHYSCLAPAVTLRRYRSTARRHPFHGHIDCALYSAIPHARCNGCAF